MRASSGTQSKLGPWPSRMRNFRLLRGVARACMSWLMRSSQNSVGSFPGPAPPPDSSFATFLASASRAGLRTGKPGRDGRERPTGRVWPLQSRVLNYAQAKGWRVHDALTKSVTLGLPRQTGGGNFAAMPYAEVPALLADRRRKPPTTGRDALMFMLFTAARSGEVRSARWSHIDFEVSTWNRPAHLMKNRTAHTVTLNRLAVAFPGAPLC